ncbi:O-antigen ligase family protein [Candidatus Parcubacteria bacterium]|nr:O-antigen ligase family protein [Candidatus Parcubacteria bacterium]
MSSRTVLLTLLVITSAIVALGVLPREALLIWTGLALFFVACSPLEEGLALFLASMPILPALTLGPSDNLNAWIFLIPVLGLRAWLERPARPSNRMSPDTPATKHLVIGAHLLLGVAALSVLIATDRTFALERLLFLVLTLLLAAIVGTHIGRGGKREVLTRALCTGIVIVVLIGFLQLVLVKALGLNTFWSFWALSVIPMLFGEALSQVLLVSNSWFNFLPATPPTLRIFSVFPDSHSFAMWLILSIPLVLLGATSTAARARQRWRWWALVIAVLLGIILSGSRGTWISALPVLAAALVFLPQTLRRWWPTLSQYISRLHAGIVAATIVLFFALFPAASLLLKLASNQRTSSEIIYERALTITDISEISNQGRLRIWKTTLAAIVHRPLLGVGLGNYPLILEQSPRESKKGSSAHNLYLQLTAELGIAGLGVFLWLGWTTLRESLRLGATMLQPPLASFVGAFLFWAAGYSMFDVVLLQSRVWLLALTVIMLALWPSGKHELQPATEHQ